MTAPAVLVGMGSAIIEGPYRYALRRKWGAGRCMAFVMLNPSTADGGSDDATIRRCLRFTADQACTELVVVNLYAWRTTNPHELWRASDPIGPDNDAHILTECKAAHRVVCAWGAPMNRRVHDRAAHVYRMLRTNYVDPEALRLTRGGYPQHPLYLPGGLRPFRFVMEGSAS